MYLLDMVGTRQSPCMDGLLEVVDCMMARIIRAMIVCNILLSDECGQSLKLLRRIVDQNDGDQKLSLSSANAASDH